jgi:PAS domain S-box-containing protein
MHDGPDEGAFIDVGLDAEERIIAYRKLRLAGEDSPCLYIRASTPLKAAEAVARKAQLRNMLLLSPFFGVAVILALLISKYCFVDRIAALQRAVQRVATGDLDVRVESTVSGGELGELGQAFDGMARQLAAREKARQAAVHELLESKKKYQAIFKGATDAIFVHPIMEGGLPGTFVEVNDRACEHLGYGRKELLRLSPSDIDAPRFRKQLPAVTQELVTKGHVVFESAHLTRDGRCIPVEVTSRLLHIDHTTLVYSIVHVIGEQERGAGAAGQPVA